MSWLMQELANGATAPPPPAAPQPTRAGKDAGGQQDTTSMIRFALLQQQMGITSSASSAAAPGHHQCQHHHSRLLARPGHPHHHHHHPHAHQSLAAAKKSISQVLAEAIQQQGCGGGSGCGSEPSLQSPPTGGAVNNTISCGGLLSDISEIKDFSARSMVSTQHQLQHYSPASSSPSSIPPSAVAVGVVPPPPPPLVPAASCGSTAALPAASEIKMKQVGLPSKLYAILSSGEYDDGVMSWCPHGRAWKIKDLDAFVDRVLHVYFDFGSYPRTFATFIRLLKLWGFKQITSGPDTAAYYHSLFLRGKPDLLGLMRPALNTDPMHCPENEPDFYRMPPLPQQQEGSVSAAAAAAAPVSTANINNTKSNDPTLALIEAVLGKNGNGSASPSALSQVSRLRELLASAHHAPSEAPPAVSVSPPRTMGGSATNGNVASFLAASSPQQPQRTNNSRNDAAAAAARRVHEKNVRYLSDARMVADDPPAAAPPSALPGANYVNVKMSAIPSVSAPPPPVAVKPSTPTTKPPAAGKSSSKSSQSPKKNANSTGRGSKKPKKPRKKWLPPLGPPTSKATALLCNLGGSSGSSAASASASAAANNSQDYEWIFTNAEVFASLSEKGK